MEGFFITHFDCRVVTGSCFPAAPWQPFFTSDVTTFYWFDTNLIASSLASSWPAGLLCCVSVASQLELASLAVDLDQRQTTLIKVSWWVIIETIMIQEKKPKYQQT